MAKLVKGVVYALTVEALTKIKGPVKDKYFLHFSFYDSRTQIYKGEFETTDQHQQYFLPGKKAFFFVCEVQKYGELISPMPDEYTQKEDYRDMSDLEKAHFYPDAPAATASPDINPVRQSPTKTVAGTSYSVSIGLAVTLYGSLSGCLGIDSYDKEKLFEMADDIENYLLKRQNAQEG